MKDCCLVFNTSKIEIIMAAKNIAVAFTFEKVKAENANDDLRCGGSALFALKFLPCKSLY